MMMRHAVSLSLSFFFLSSVPLLESPCDVCDRFRVDPFKGFDLSSESRLSHGRPLRRIRYDRLLSLSLFSDRRILQRMLNAAADQLRRTSRGVPQARRQQRPAVTG